jgi:DNA-binding NarL/FixJ family response regulator
MCKIRIIIADDHKIFTNSLKFLIESNELIEVVDEVFDGNELIASIRKNEVDIILLDINMPNKNGIEVLNYFANSNETIPKFIVISMFVEKIIQSKLELMGVMAFHPKNVNAQELFATIFDVYNNKRPAKRSLNFETIDGNPIGLLTRKEKEILLEISNGLSNQAIADKFFNSLFTIQTHRRNIHEKLGIKGHAALLNFVQFNKHLL